MATRASVLLRSHADGDGLERVGGRLATWRARADDLVRQRPLQLTALMAALGYGIGWLLLRPASRQTRKRRRR